MREARVASVVAAVTRQALEDWGARRVALLDDGSPEAVLAARMLEGALGTGGVVRVRHDPALEPLLQSAAAELSARQWADELRRLRARLLGDALPASPANKTALLLGGPLPPEPLLPLGDLYASQVEELVGGWSAPPEVERLAQLAGGVAALDAALRALLEERDPAGLGRLCDAAREGVEAALRRGGASRLAVRTVPKIGTRTIGLDLFQ